MDLLRGGIYEIAADRIRGAKVCGIPLVDDPLLLVEQFDAPGEKMPSTPKSYTKTEDIPYAPELGAMGLGDLYLPEGWTADTPLALLIHGGGWNHGDRYSWSGVAEFFARDLGMAAFNIEYRLVSATNLWPCCGDDCVKAAKYLLSDKFSRTFGLKPGKIWICGGSAGGHLALWTALSIPAEKVAGAISVSGIGDPGPDKEKHPDRYRFMQENCDPRSLIKAGGPRILLTHADGDAVVPIESARHFQSAYLDAGNPLEFFEYPHDVEPNEGGHCIWVKGSNPHRLISTVERGIREFCHVSDASAAPR